MMRNSRDEAGEAKKRNPRPVLPMLCWVQWLDMMTNRSTDEAGDGKKRKPRKALPVLCWGTWSDMTTSLRDEACEGKKRTLRRVLRNSVDVSYKGRPRCLGI